MKTSLYTLTAAGFIILSAICVLLILIGLRYSLRGAGFSRRRQNRIFYCSLLLIIVWVAAMCILASQGFFSDFSGFPPRIILIMGPFLAILGLTFTQTVTALVQHVPPAWLLYLQAFRIPVEILLWLLFVQNLIPVQMTFEGRNFDILAGITAPVVGYLCLARKSLPRWVAVVWNLASLGLLFNIVAISILSAPVTFRYFFNEPANTIMAQFPFILLPMVLVPVAYTLHFFSLRQLLTQPQGRPHQQAPVAVA